MSRAMFDSVIFDVDGTIWDTTPVVAEGWNMALRESGINDITITAARLKGLFGLPMDAIIEDILPDASDELKKRFEPLSYKYEQLCIEKKSGILYEGLTDTVKALSERYPLYVVSNCQAGYIELMLCKTGMTPFFKDFTCYGDNGLYKAQNIRLIMERNGLKNPVYVGDTQMDANACKEAGVPIVYAAYGFGKVDAPYATIKTPAELLQVL